MTHTPSTLKALDSHDATTRGSRAYFANLSKDGVPVADRADWKAAQRLHKSFIREAKSILRKQGQDTWKWGELVNAMFAHHDLGACWSHS